MQLLGCSWCLCYMWLPERFYAKIVLVFVAADCGCCYVVALVFWVVAMMLRVI